MGALKIVMGMEKVVLLYIELELFCSPTSCTVLYKH